MTETEAKVLEALRQLNREITQVFSFDVAAEIEKSARLVRLYLARLEQAGLVQRPNGKNSGWVAA